MAFYFLLGNFVEIVLVSKNALRGSHCGRTENVAIAIRRRRRMSQATFFILYKRFCCKIPEYRKNSVPDIDKTLKLM